MANKYCKYYKQEQLVSYDSGKTWQSTGLYQKGDIYEQDSADCGFLSSERWHTYYTYCDGTSLMAIMRKERLSSSGKWVLVVPVEEQTVELNPNASECSQS